MTPRSSHIRRVLPLLIGLLLVGCSPLRAERIAAAIGSAPAAAMGSTPTPEPQPAPQPYPQSMANGLTGDASCAAATARDATVSCKLPPKYGVPPGSPVAGLEQGVKVDIGGYALYLRCVGQGEPTVVFDSGLGASSEVWTHGFDIQDAVGASTRTCVYDRPGLGQSERRPGAVTGTSELFARELHRLLRYAGVTGPFVLAGHSVGGLDIRLYAYLYPHQVAGLVFIDSSQELQCTGQTTGFCGGAAELDGERYDLPASFVEINVRDHFRITGSLGDRPIVVLTAQNEGGRPTDANGTVSPWFLLQRLILSTSSSGVMVIAEKSDHLIPNEQPALVAYAVLQDAQAVRSGTLASCGTGYEALQGMCVAG
jgi:hypothetical protein